MATANAIFQEHIAEYPGQIMPSANPYLNHILHILIYQSIGKFESPISNNSIYNYDMIIVKLIDLSCYS